MLEPEIQDPRPSSRVRSRWWSREDLLLLILLGALFFLPGLGQIPLFDRDEPRFATAGREMLRSGDYIVPRFNGDIRPDKPPLVYWLMSASYRAVGGFNELGARLPSAIASMFTLLVVYFMVGSRLGRITGLVAAIMLGSCALFIVESRMATADAAMLLFTVICMACAWEAWDAGGGGNGAARAAPAHLPRTDYLLYRTADGTPHVLDHLPPTGRRRMSFLLAMIFWIALACGTLTKGVPLFFVLVPMVALSMASGTLPAELRRWRSHLHLGGLRIGIALTVAAAMIALVASPALSNARWPVAVFGALLVAMVLTPGLPGVLFRCLAGGNWSWWRHLRPFLGIPLLIALVGWWVVLAGVATDWKLITRMVGEHFLSRIAGPLLSTLHIAIADVSRPGGNDAMQHYAQPPGFYLLLIWVTFWPWSVLLVPTAYHGLRRLLGRTAIAIDPGPYQFLIAWIVPMWIILELSRGKLLHYPLPLYVGIAILCADAVVQSWSRLTDVLCAGWFAMSRWLILAIWLGMSVVVLFAAREYLDAELFWRSIPFAGALAGAGVAGTIAWNGRSWPFVTALAWACALLLLDTLVLPGVDAIQIGRSVGQRMAQMKQEDPSLNLAALGFEEPSLVFYADQQIAMGDAAGALLKSSRKYLAAVDSNPDPAHPGAAENLRKKGVEFVTLMQRDGFDTGNTRPVTVLLITNPSPKGAPAQRPSEAPATRGGSPQGR